MTEPNKELPKYAPIIEAKDSVIRGLEEQARLDGLSKELLNAALSEQKATISKLMGLLKDVYIQSITDFRESRDVNYEDLPTPNELFEAYCKENGIDLGGE